MPELLAGAIWTTVKPLAAVSTLGLRPAAALASAVVWACAAVMANGAIVWAAASASTAWVMCVLRSFIKVSRVNS